MPRSRKSCRLFCCSQKHNDETDYSESSSSDDDQIESNHTQHNRSSLSISSESKSSSSLENNTSPSSSVVSAKGAIPRNLLAISCEEKIDRLRDALTLRKQNHTVRIHSKINQEIGLDNRFKSIDGYEFYFLSAGYNSKYYKVLRALPQKELERHVQKESHNSTQTKIPRLGDIRLMRPEAGWKFHLSVDCTLEGNLQKAFEIWLEVVMEYQLNDSKVIKASLSTQGDGREFCIYLFKSPKIEKKQWHKIIYIIEKLFRENKIKPGKVNRCDRKVPGSRYCYYRHDGQLRKSELYCSESNAIIIANENQLNSYNLNNLEDPFEALNLEFMNTKNKKIISLSTSNFSSSTPRNKR